MERTLQSSVTTKRWSATQSGWTLSFTHETGGAAETIYCIGSNEAGGQVNANLNVENNTSGINFNGVSHDSTLAAAIITEMQTILTEEGA